MLERRTLAILGALVAAYFVLALPAYLGPAALREYSSVLVMPVILSLYVFHRLGVPGLLENDGVCGWGWCGPTAFGLMFLTLFWLALAWLAAWALARFFRRLQR
jgi:hypothetical protein